MNKQVKIDKRTIIYPEWFNRGVNDFVNDDGSFLTLDQFSNKFGFCVNFLQYNGVISSLRQMLKLYPYGDKSSNSQTPFVPSSLQNIFRSPKGSKDMYRYTILKKNSSVPTAQRKWNTVFDINSNEWKQIYILPFKVTASTKLHWFQFRDRPFNLKGLWFFVSFRIFFSDNTRVRIFIFFVTESATFFPEFNIRLYDKNSESDYFFFPPPKSEYFFQQHWESEYFFRKKTITPPPPPPPPPPFKLNGRSLRINHNILATNYFLKKIKIIDDAKCNFCQNENETIEHIFGGCENVQNLLGQVNSSFGDKDINQTFLKKTLIFGDVDKV